MAEPPRGQDPLALAVLGTAAALAAAVALYVVFAVGSRPEEPAGATFPERVRGALKGLIAELAEEKRAPPAAARPQPPAPKPREQPQKPQAQAQAQPPASASPPPAPPRGVIFPEAGRTWRYDVKVEPEVWKEITLTYTTIREPGGLGVRTEFRHAGGKSAFHLGIFAPHHPTHANTRFPGFFMYAAYLDHPLEVGKAVAFEWPWQAGGQRPGRVKRFEGKVVAWDQLRLPGVEIPAARIEGALSYVEDGRVAARAQETFWYAPKASQVVKIVRVGRVPDESAGRIVAELADFR
jgi:hypothetical protein